jgi:hypothetical protein
LGSEKEGCSGGCLASGPEEKSFALVSGEKYGHTPLGVYPSRYLDGVDSLFLSFLTHPGLTQFIYFSHQLSTYLVELELPILIGSNHKRWWVVFFLSVVI